MAIKKVTLPSGTLKYEVVKDGPRDAQGKRKQMRRRFSTLKEAKAWEASTTVEIDKGTFVGREKITLDAYLDEWLAGLDRKPSTIANYRDALKPARRTMGAKLLQQVTKADVQAMVAGMKDGSLRVQGRPGTPLSPRAIRLSLTILGLALEAAKKEQRVSVNVAALVDKPSPSKGKRKCPWTNLHVQQFQAAAAQDRLGGVWMLSLCGLRRGEVLAMSWNDLDLERGRVRVHRSRVLVDGQSIMQDTTKTTAGERTVPLLPEHVAALKAMKHQQDHERDQAGTAYADSDGLLAVDALGRPVQPRWYTDRFQALCRQAGVPVVKLHDARHAYGSMLHDQGVNIAIISRLMGHSNVNVTMGIYVHDVEQENDDRVLEAMRGAGYAGPTLVAV